MLHIILVILKIIGIIILAILGLLLGLLLLVSLVPIRYLVTASCYGKPQGIGKISWLLHIVSLSCHYNEQVTVTVRIMGFRIGRRKKPSKQVVETAKDAVESEIAKVEKRVFEQPDPIQTPINTEHHSEVPDDHDTESASPSQNPILHLWGKVKAFFQKLKSSYKRICEKLRTIKINIEAVKAWVGDEKNQSTLKLILRQLKAVIHHILPGKAKGKVIFGFDDPYTTGQVLSWVSILYPLCHKQLQICPVFDRAVIEGDIYLKGRIRLGTILLLLLRIYMNKNFRVLLKKYR